MELSNKTIEMAKELRQILSSIKGTKKISENLVLSYIVIVEDKKDKKAVKEVAEALTSQAAENGVDLEIASATEKEIEEAKTKMAQKSLKMLNKGTTFKA